MRVYSVVTLITDPHGEVMGDGRTHAVFSTRKAANAFMRELKEVDSRRGGYRQQYGVRSFKVED